LKKKMMGGFGLPSSHLGDVMEIQERINITKQGQLTWANPDIGAKCEECSHFKNDPAKPPLGKFALVKAHTRKVGKSFDGRFAIACSKFLR